MVVERYLYDPYGQLTVLTGSWGSRSSSSYGWQYFLQGKRFDTTVGLYDSREREESPTMARWLQEDPLGITARDMNIYRFVADNPLNAIDPTGFDIISPNPYYPVDDQPWLRGRTTHAIVTIVPDWTYGEGAGTWRTWGRRLPEAGGLNLDINYGMPDMSSVVQVLLQYRPGAIDRLNLGGHDTGGGPAFANRGKGIPQLNFNGFNSLPANQLKQIRQRFGPGAQLWIYACTSGAQHNHNDLRKLAKLLGVTVNAPTGSPGFPWITIKPYLLFGEPFNFIPLSQLEINGDWYRFPPDLPDSSEPINLGPNPPGSGTVPRK